MNDSANTGTEDTMDLPSFDALLGRHGADSRQWPANLRASALAFVARTAEAQQLLEEQKHLEQALEAHWPSVETPLGLRTRILANATNRDSWLEWLTVKLWRPALLACLPLALGIAVGANVADDAADLEDQLLIAFADADQATALEAEF